MYVPRPDTLYIMEWEYALSKMAKLCTNKVPHTFSSP